MTDDEMKDLLLQLAKIQEEKSAASAKTQAAAKTKTQRRLEFIRTHGIPILEKHFAVYRDHTGVDRIYSVNERREVVKLATMALPREMLITEWRRIYKEEPTEHLLDAVLKRWLGAPTKLVHEPVPFIFGHKDTQLCYRRFDNEPAPGPHPAWDEFLVRLSDRGAFEAFVWSIFEPANKSRQFLWLYGDGGEGKSQVLKVLSDMFEPASIGITDSLLHSERFLMSSFYGKRLAVYADCRNAKFPQSELVRNCTSGDNVSVEFKMQQTFTWQMYVKLMVASNERPQLNTQGAEQTRLVYLEVAPSKNTDDPTWIGRLKAELLPFLWTCKQSYAALCPNHGNIRVSAESLEKVQAAGDSFEERFSVIFEKYFEPDASARTASKDIYAVLERSRMGPHEIANFKAWLTRVHKVYFRKSGSRRYYCGIRVRDFTATAE